MQKIGHSSCVWLKILLTYLTTLKKFSAKHSKVFNWICTYLLRIPNTRLLQKKTGGSHAKKNTASTTQKITEATDAQLTVQCIRAMTIMDCEVSPESKGKKIDNPPIIVRATNMIHHCHGYRGDIKASDKEYPHNMVFQQHRVVGYLNRVKNEWVESEQNIHFHLKMACLRKNDGTMEAWYIVTNDKTFLWLDQQQMEWLHAQGFLKAIACKKCIM